MNLVVVNGVRVRPTSRRVRKQHMLGKRTEGTVVESREGLAIRVRLASGRDVTGATWQVIDCDQTQAAYVEYVIAGGCLTCFGMGEFSSKRFVDSGGLTQVTQTGCSQCGKVRKSWWK